MTTHAEARELGRQAVAVVFNRDPVGGEVAGVAGVAFLETGYGDGWKGAGKGSNNQGAIQCGAGWTGDRFSYTDTHPNSDGTNTKYQVDFRKYATPILGWVDLVKVVYVNRKRSSVRAAAIDHDWYQMSRCLHDTGYYEGYGRTVAERIQNHYRALSRAIAKADGAAAPIIPVLSLPKTVRKGNGCRGTPDEAVKLLQMELRLAADGIFGPATETALKLYQMAHGLVADGICGPKTWEVLFHDEYTPQAA